MSHPDLFRFSIDRGGTFTDIYAEIPGQSGYRVLKLLSENPNHYPDAPLEGIRRILQETAESKDFGEGMDPACIEWIRMGTTVATNALLERKGARMALLVTRGFRDLLEIGKQNRPRIFDLVIQKPPPLYEMVVEIDERVRLLGEAESGQGERVVKGITGETLEVLRAPDMDKIRKDLLGLKEQGINSLAVVFLHAFIYPKHEQQVGSLAVDLGFSHVSLSSQVMPRIKMVDRGHTCCVDAYLTPHIRSYLEGFRSGFGEKEPPLYFMQSDGGLVDADSFTGSRAIVSGPAGGVVGCALTAFDRENRQPVIGFDMGGTSTDVSRFDGEFEWVHESETGGVWLQVPQLDIRTVAAGGGSRLEYQNGLFRSGPESSGAWPGPVCYRNGGPLSLTDANLFLGRLIPEFFPSVFGPSEDQSLDRDTTRNAFLELTDRINADLKRRGKHSMSPEDVACGFVEVANETMVRPIREISVERGYDIKDHVLACFGGAGGQHACALARSLGISKVFVHRFAGILSAYGMGLADIVVELQEPAAETLGPHSLPGLSVRLDSLMDTAVRQLRKKGDFQVEIRRYLNMRYQGTDTAMMILEPPDRGFERQFKTTHFSQFGFDLPGRDILVDDIRVRVTGKSKGLKREFISKRSEPAVPVIIRPCYFDGDWQETPVYHLEDFGSGGEVAGPAIIINDTSTLVIEPGCSARINEFGDVEIAVPTSPRIETGEEVDPVRLSVFGNRFMSIAEQMGRTLQRTAISTNIKERMDFSCAIFGPHGDLVANAPHQPVHLGAMGEAVSHQYRIHRDDLSPGDVWVTNHPIVGGSHLPDITVITPVLKEGKPVFFVANRGHHADIGGITPGSMPPFSRTLEEEGACIKSFKLVEAGIFQEQGIMEILTESRALADNLSDLKAQVAANQKGIDLLEEMIAQYSLPVVQAYMGYIQNAADEAVRNLLKEVSFSRNLKERDTLEAVEHLDDGSPVRLTLTIDRRDGSAVFDFSGTGSELPGNLNTPRAVTHSAILYCLRCLVHGDIPLNQGCLHPIEIIVPNGSLLSPSEHAAVAAGNVLTSQRITDVVLKAFGACAASQGCMNNFTFGNDRFGYYETIGGGAGAGRGWNGQSGVHTHMTNTRITDPEVLEKRYPVLLREFALRRGSGGAGRFRGGDGLVREMEFLEPLHVAILSERRVYAPYGMEGGAKGAKGKNLLIKKDGTEVDLGGKNEMICESGDRIRILTPGGGGWGSSRGRRGHDREGSL